MYMYVPVLFLLPKYLFPGPHFLLFSVAVEEENEMDVSIPRNNNYDKMTPLQKHQIRHRELFLSRQIETYKIDMVRYI